MASLRAIWQDMVDKRLWPVALGLVVAAVAAVVLLGGGSSAPVPVPPAPKIPGLPTPVAVTPVGSAPAQQVADTVNGVADQRAGHARDPFATSTSSSAASAATVAAVTKASAAAVSASASAITRPTVTKSAVTNAPSAPSPPTAPPSTAPATAPATSPPSRVGYAVSVLFGAPSAPKRLDDLRRLTPLPSAASALLSYVGVRKDGRTATFALLQGALLSGPAACRPSPTQCQLIDIKVGEQPELLQFVSDTGTIQTFALQVVSVVRKHAVAARVSAAGRALLRREAPSALSHLDYAVGRGVLVRRVRRGHGLTRALLGLGF